MQVKNARVSVVLGSAHYGTLVLLARRDGATVSTKAHDLLRDALEMHENGVLKEIAAERERSIDPTKTLTHDAVWRHRLRRK